MANDVAGDPLILDTAAAAITSATVPYWIRKIAFRGAAAGDSAIFEDGAGRIIARLAAPNISLMDSLDFNPPKVVYGLELASISAGGVADVYGR